MIGNALVAQQAEACTYEFAEPEVARVWCDKINRGL